MELFEKYKVFEYLDKFYDVLHTTGHRYIINDIDSYIEARINAQSKIEYRKREGNRGVMLWGPLILL